jgi:hypothetical protein
MMLDCRGTTRPLAITCGDQNDPTEDARGIIVGANTHAKVASSNVLYDASTEEFSFDVSVTSYMPQPMGTADGVTPSPSGVHVFFDQPLVVTAGSGTATILNADGAEDTYFGPNQAYFRYSGALLGPDGILSNSEKSGTKRWRFSMPATVEGFAFRLNVSGDVPFPHGWVDFTPVGSAVILQGTRSLNATVRSPFGMVISFPVIWGSSDPSIATVDGAGVVTGVSLGTATITATTTDGLRTGSTAVTVCPDLGLAVGGVAHLTMPGDASFCLGGGAAGAEYVVVPVNFTGADAGLTATASGVVPVTGAPSPTLLGGGGRPALSASRISSLRAADAFERRLREREADELTRLIPAAGRAFRTKTAGTGARRSITPGVPTVGALMPLNVESSGSCEAPVVRNGRVQVVGAHVIVMADTTSPSGLLTTADYQAIADRFDTLIWPTLTANFGAPEDIDGNGRVIVFFTSAVNALTPAGSAPVTHGYTLRRDLFFTSSCVGSNEGEIIYLAVPDLAGTVNGNARSIASVKAAAAPTLGHEMAHLINASRRLYVNFAPAFEEEWLDEGLAQVAEELLFHAAAGKQPRQNLGFAQVTSDSTARAAFLAYAEPQLARLRQSLQSPETPVGSGAWGLLRYAADRKGGTESAFWSALVNSTTTGYSNFTAAVGTAPNPWVRDTHMAFYTDDAVFGVAAAYTMPSWNLRSLYDALDYDGDRLADGYPLAARSPVDGVPSVITLAPSGRTYLRMVVPAGGVASVTLQSNGAAPPSTLMVSVVRRK